MIAVLVVVGMAIAITALNTSPKTTTTKNNDRADTADVVVILTPDGYEPAEFTIPVNTTVTFKSTTGKPHWPASNLHPTHDIYSEFDPKRPLEPDEAWSFTFDQVGRWNFHDHIRAYYTGTVYVSED